MIEPALGAACGAAVGVWFDVTAVVVLFRMARRPGSWAAALLRDRSPVVLVSPLLLFHALWTVAGLLLGLGYWAVSRNGSGEVSIAYVVAVGSVAALGVLMTVLKGRAHAVWLVSFAGVFFGFLGLLLPFWAAASR